jgi:hypothetical protein
METDTEMQQEGRGTSDTQVYTNLTLTLAIAEPDFEKTMVKGKNVQITRPQTADGGRTWRVEKIIIPAILPGTQWVPPAGKSKSSSSTGFGSSGRNEGKNGSEESSSSGTSDGGRPTWIPKGWIPTDGGMFGKGTRGKVTNRFMRR